MDQRLEHMPRHLQFAIQTAFVSPGVTRHSTRKDLDMPFRSQEVREIGLHLTRGFNVISLLVSVYLDLIY
jgi:hypothetical protein